MGTPASKRSAMKKAEMGRVNFEPYTLQWLKDTGGIFVPVSKSDCADEDCSTALFPLIDMLEQAFPNALTIADYVEALRNIRGLTNVSVLIETLNGATPEEMREINAAQVSRLGSGWIEDATGRYGEDDGQRGTPGITNVSAL